MAKLAILLALLFIVTMYKIYRDYEGDKKKFALDTALLLFLLFATGFSKYARIYLPLFVVHLVLVLFAWGYYYLYLFGRARSIISIFAPLLSIITFFILGYFSSQT